MRTTVLAMTSATCVNWGPPRNVARRPHPLGRSSKMSIATDRGRRHLDSRAVQLEPLSVGSATGGDEDELSGEPMAVGRLNGLFPSRYLYSHRALPEDEGDTLCL